MIVALASSIGRPSRLTDSLLELIAGPSPRYGPSPGIASSNPAGGCTVRTIGSPNVSANSQSRSSCPGTAMIAPVPYPART